jgi:aromatic ring-opening dioxygenase catalytic subunit (LigB family)
MIAMSGGHMGKSRINSWNVAGKFYSQHSNNRHNMPLTYALGLYPNTTHWWVLMHTY